MKFSVLVILIALAFSYAQFPEYTENPSANPTLKMVVSDDNCADLDDSDFRITKLVTLLGSDDVLKDPTLKDPMKMDFVQDSATGKVSIYFIERFGKIKYYDADFGPGDALKVVGIMDIRNLGGNSDEIGLIGMILDPDFQKNGYIYFYWTPNTGSHYVYRLSRFRINLETNTLDMGSEKVLLEVPFPKAYNWFHNGGGLSIDDKRNLWLSVGETYHCGHSPQQYHGTDKDCNGEHTSTDTYSYAGSILRIHLEDDGSYTIPEDNFGEYWSKKFTAEGRTALSNMYKDTSRVRPELYAKGFRNPTNIVVDSKTGWAAVSECGAQCHKVTPVDYCPTHGKTEKHMLVTEPSFHGWNYFIADNHPWAIDGNDKRDPLKPANNSPFHIGADTLPPAVPATYMYGTPSGDWSKGEWICSVGGTYFRYNWFNPSPISLPPHFDKKMIVSDYNVGWKRVVEVDTTTGKFVKASGDLWESLLDTTLNINVQSTGKGNVMDLKHGPDGAIYLLNYSQYQYARDKSTGLYRIEYHGNCRPKVDYIEAVERPRINKSLLKTGYLNFEGKYTVDFFTLEGRKVFVFEGKGKERLPLSNLQNSGLYKLRVTTENGEHHYGVFMKM
ncbi:MAG: PQQ-dependent sugar dehydrogenase [Fibrobacteria bacterium]|nr:PQQ-dependent sugar dehydrogenase [Fibrobacteria bacterium]